MEPAVDNPTHSLTRVRLYREFLGKQAESCLIALFVKQLADGYGIATESGPSLRVVDVGCGIGRMLHHFAVDFKWNTLAIDPDQDYFNESVKVATKLCGDFPEAQLQVINAGFAGIPSKNYYQMIVAINGPFYYLLTPQERFNALRVVYESLTPGGIVLLDMANFQYLLHQLGPVGERTVTKDIDGMSVVRVMNVDLDWHNSVWTHRDDFYFDSKDEADNNLICREKHSFCITSPSDITFMMQQVGFVNFKFFNGWTSDAVKSETLTGMRIIISAQKGPSPLPEPGSSTNASE